ncbi:hypothetical protein ABT357_30400, partial [Streptomyces albidoflavus]|uniref:hypothetical protein n=1 Tax=Streptomyces albidoflavus TaxID=1886 RepID=UPI00332E4A27
LSVQGWVRLVLMAMVVVVLGCTAVAGALCETSPRREARRSREGGVRRRSSDPALTEPAW